MSNISRKEFVSEGTELPPTKSQDIIVPNITGEEVSKFYDSFVCRSEGESVDGKQANQSVHDKYYCEICDIEIERTKKTEHTLSVSHQFHRNKDRAPKKSYSIPTGNPGYQILLKNGWNEKGLGKREDGSLDPIKTILKNDRLGIGIKPLCPSSVTHKALNPPRRPNLHHRTIPKNLEKMDIFSALDALKKTDEQQYAVSVRHRTLLLKRDRIKHNLLYQEIYK